MHINYIDPYTISEIERKKFMFLKQRERNARLYFDKVKEIESESKHNNNNSSGLNLTSDVSI